MYGIDHAVTARVARSKKIKYAKFKQFQKGQILKNEKRPIKGLLIQVSLFIRGRYVPSFLTVNPAFADKKSIFD